MLGPVVCQPLANFLAQPWQKKVPQCLVSPAAVTHSRECQCLQTECLWHLQKTWWQRSDVDGQSKQYPQEVTYLVLQQSAPVKALWGMARLLGSQLRGPITSWQQKQSSGRWSSEGQVTLRARKQQSIESGSRPSIETLFPQVTPFLHQSFTSSGFRNSQTVPSHGNLVTIISLMRDILCIRVLH